MANIAQKAKTVTGESIIIRCDCKHSWQDETYGPQLRVHNHAPANANAQPIRYRCTVCGNTKNHGTDPRQKVVISGATDKT